MAGRSYSGSKYLAQINPVGISNGVNWKIKVSRIAQTMYKVEITILELNDIRQDENLFVKRKK